MEPGSVIESGMWEGFEVISVYTRAQAIEDGELIDVTSMAKEAGLSLPTAVTRALWADIEAIPPHRSCEDVTGRLWDVLWMGALAIRRAVAAGREGSQLTYGLILHVGQRSHYRVKLVIGPGDDAEPVITLMLPDED